MSSTVYFHQRADHRSRQKDTPKQARKYLTVLSNLKETPKSEISKVRESRFKEFIVRYFLPFVPLLKLCKIPDIHKNADFVYTWFAIPFNSKKPYVIELDNPYTLTYYNYWAFQLLKPVIRKILLSSRCHKIVCMSEACRLSLINEIGPVIADKTCVLYPYAPDFTNKHEKHHKLTFLFIGLNFLIKGGKETLRAFHEIAYKDCELLVVGNVDDELRNQYSVDKRIKFLGEMKREELFNRIYPISDVLIFPTLYESFGMVALEALSFGLGIITTDTYALPELVRDRKNGILIHHPFLKPVCYDKKCFVDVTKWTVSEFYCKFLKKNFCEPLYFSIKKTFLNATKNYKHWQNNSKQVYEERFSEKKWRSSLLEIFK